jgi:hypothetical protein
MAAAVVLGSAIAASASGISLSLVDSAAKSSAFGLAFDGTNVWWSDSSNVVHQMGTDLVDTGTTFDTGIWSELAWDGSHILQVSDYGSTIYYWNTDGTSAGSHVMASSACNSGFSLTDGLDYDNGELWCSPDISDVYRLSGNGDTDLGGGAVLAGSYSGVERIEASDGTNYIVVVNDGSNPRQLCVHNMDYSLVGCQDFVNDRYEGLAFDGRYIYAADLYGNKIDKFDILGADGGSIIDPGPGGQVPLPAAGWLLGGALMGIAGLRRRRGKQA